MIEPLLVYDYQQRLDILKFRHKAKVSGIISMSADDTRIILTWKLPIDVPNL